MSARVLPAYSPMLVLVHSVEHPDIIYGSGSKQFPNIPPIILADITRREYDNAYDTQLGCPRIDCAFSPNKQGVQNVPYNMIS